MERRIAKFRKVSFEQFLKDVRATGRFENMSDSLLREYYDSIKLPHRSTKLSAGYDIVTPLPFECNSNWTLIPTGICCEMDEGWALFIMPKSGLGYKCRTTLANTIGLVDADYVHSDNEGHIMVKIKSETEHDFSAGDKMVQGVFLPHGITEDDDAAGERNGGFGSTGR